MTHNKDLIPKTNLKQHIYSAVLENIIQGEYAPDELINEKTLVEKFGVSKSPVREALIELCNEDVLRSIPRAGYEVVRITDADVKDLQEYRIILECTSMDRYWDMFTPQSVDKLQLLLDEHYQQLAEYDVFTHWKLNTDFHSELVAVYQNRFLHSNLIRALKVLQRAYAQFYWDKWQQIRLVGDAGYHKKILTFIRNNDKQEALDYLKKDISEFDGLERI